MKVAKIKELGPCHMLFFNQKFDNVENEGLSWFGIDIIVSFQDITQNVLQFGKKTHTQLTLKFANSTWSVLLIYIDDTLSVYCAIGY